STATVDQGASHGGSYYGPNHRGGGYHHFRDGSHQWAFINQNDGWGHDASIVQRGQKLEATINQRGLYNTAEVDQRGTGGTHNEADITQNGSYQYASVKQDGF